MSTLVHYACLANITLSLRTKYADVRFRRALLDTIPRIGKCFILFVFFFLPLFVSVCFRFTFSWTGGYLVSRPHLWKEGVWDLCQAPRWFGAVEPSVKHTNKRGYPFSFILFCVHFSFPSCCDLEESWNINFISSCYFLPRLFLWDFTETKRTNPSFFWFFIRFSPHLINSI